MSVVDIAIRILLGMVSVGFLVYITFGIVAPILMRIGKSVAPDMSEAGQLSLGFILCLISAILLIGIWVIGNYLAIFVGL